MSHSTSSINSDSALHLSIRFGQTTFGRSLWGSKMVQGRPSAPVRRARQFLA